MTEATELTQTQKEFVDALLHQRWGNIKTMIEQDESLVKFVDPHTGGTVLHWAVHDGQTDMVLWLSYKYDKQLEKKVVNKEGKTAASMAQERDWPFLFVFGLIDVDI